MMFDKKEVGCRIKAARMGKGLSQKEAASIINQPQQAWGRYEKGVVAPGAEILHKICSALEVSSDWIIGLPERGAPTQIIAHGAGAMAAGRDLNAGGVCSKCQLMQAHIREITGRP